MLNTVGILSPGDMGHTVGDVIRQNGLRVITCLQGRSQRTQQLAEKAGIQDVPTYPQFVTEADLSSSQSWSLHRRCLLPPQSQKHSNRWIPRSLMPTATPSHHRRFVSWEMLLPLQAELSWMPPSSGHPPRNPGATRFYASGPDLESYSQNSIDYGLDVRHAQRNEIGLASAIKMCYASLTKGLTALCTELLTAAQVLGVSDALTAEFQLSQSALFERMENGLPGMPPKAKRWIGEMEEISATFAHVGLTPNILTGAADMYRFVGKHTPR